MSAGQCYPCQLAAPRYKTLDAWRGIACLLVVVFHSTYYAVERNNTRDAASWFIDQSERGHIGVPMFFVISGYCIAATADSSRRKGHGIRTYMARRARRIFPPYWACLALYVLAIGWLDATWPGALQDGPHAFNPPTTKHWEQWVGTVTLTEGWRYHLFGPKISFYLGHAWTLGYEEQFYAVFGVLLLLSRRYVFPLAALVTAVVLVVAPYAPSGFFFDGKWVLFACGIGVYYAVVYASLAGAVGIGFAIAGLLALQYVRPIEPKYFYMNYSVGYLFALTILALRPLDSRISQWKALAPLTFCGVICYSIYLVHWPLVKIVGKLLLMAGVDSDLETALITVPACVLSSVLVGWAFYLGVERYFLNTQRPGMVPESGSTTFPPPPSALSESITSPKFT